MSPPSSLEKATPPNRNSRRTALTVTGTQLILLAFQALGIIYSDIGTSPLYVLNGIWPAADPPPSKEDVIGGISAIVWSITLLPLLKYVIFSLHFGTGEGEGGSFALFQGLYPREETDFDSDRTLTGDSYIKPTERPNKRKLRDSFRWPLLLWCLFGTSLTMADGILTPAISVTSAVGGIAVVKPETANDIIPISIAFVVALFLAQNIGTAKLGWTFSPAAFIWFLLLAGTGIANIVQFPGIWRAWDPSRAIMFFVRTGNFSALSGVLLAVTGCEAIFANLGQFNRSSIQLSFVGLVYPSLILAYLGQGARLVVDGDAAISNVFYNTIPGPTGGPLWWIVWIFGLLATLIASQAMITATFSLIQQVINLKSFPPLRMTYTSETIQGQVFIPAVNYTLMVLCIVFIAAFDSTAALTNAYGFAVATVMISTTTLMAIQTYYVKKWPIIFGVAFFLFFCFLDALFWGASLTKVPQGAWVPLMCGVIGVALMSLWTWGKSLEDGFDGQNRQNLRHFIFVDEKTENLKLDAEPSTLMEASEDLDEDDDAAYYITGAATPISYDKTGSPIKTELVRLQSCAVFHKLATGRGVPHTFVGFIRQWPALPRVIIFLSVNVLPTARVATEDKYQVNKVRSIQGFYGVTYCLGFRDKFDARVDEIIERILALEMMEPKCSHRILEQIRNAAKITTHIVPHYDVNSRRAHSGKLGAVMYWIRSFFLEELYKRLSVMFPETGNWLTKSDEIIHVGINATI
ncbi:potassium transporter [Flagelloscypha sp. PMI_526]|nr:potassium transporter [Flagelloscypha sp. PMI_526]